MKYRVKARRAVVVYEEATVEVESISPAQAKACVHRMATTDMVGVIWKQKGTARLRVSKIEIETL